MLDIIFVTRAKRTIFVHIANVMTNNYLLIIILMNSFIHSGDMEMNGTFACVICKKLGVHAVFTEVI